MKARIPGFVCYRCGEDLWKVFEWASGKEKGRFTSPKDALDWIAVLERSKEPRGTVLLDDDCDLDQN